MHFHYNEPITFTANAIYINEQLLYRFSYNCYDEEGYRYEYSLFDLARDPSIIQKIMEAT